MDGSDGINSEALQAAVPLHDRSCAYDVVIVKKLITNSSPKLGHLGTFLRWSEPEKQTRQRDLAF
jgi:hypothetical protein